jgi:hydrogenase expression/formation protein HypD
MLRVPGSEDNLLIARAKGANIRIVYSPLDAVKIAENEPNKEVVFFAIGFETTVPANAMAVKMADLLGLKNFSIIVSQFLVPPAIDGILSATDATVQAFLAAGHVCAVMGYKEYEPLCTKYKVPIVVTGFEPIDILQGIYRCVCQLEQGVATVENQYSRVVYKDGNALAKQLINEYFAVATKVWRGIGAIPNSGLVLQDEYKYYDSAHKFGEITLQSGNKIEHYDCIAGKILQGIKKPTDCKAFGINCHPEKPLGAPMVSVEGICSAYYNYKHELVKENE